MIPAKLQAIFSKLNQSFFLFALLIVILFLQILGLSQKPLPQNNSSFPTPPQTNIADDIFSSQTATIRGKVLSLNGRNLKVENDQKIAGDFEVGRVLLINDSTNLTIASSSADLRNIQLNKETTFNLLYTDNKYVITSITYE